MKDWLLHNPIADLPGPQFLAVFALVIAALIVEALVRRWRRDTTHKLDPLPVPAKPDPFEIAYLRGGENELSRLVVFDLIRRGYLVTKGESKNAKVGQPTTPPAEAGKLSPMDLDALHYFRKDRKPVAMFQPMGLVATLRPHWKLIRESLRDQELIQPAGSVWTALRQWAMASGLLILLGGYKLVVAIAKGHHNVVFLFVMCLFGLVILGFAYSVPLRTRRGKAYLNRLREAFAGIMPSGSSGLTSPNLDPVMVLVPAVFGVSALAGGPFNEVSEIFKSSHTSSGGCGGGCGSGGCGGGGGGCGGGGCGGCGG